ncbi:MAG: glycosyltransferase [Xenococcaceae cyanobacterium MO_207.B15]|nr:glycosyltransferase [Xenococcaceae cyanobacterium MO_207.B15]
MHISAPLISVVIPAYNCELYIAEAVESVLQQQDCHFEIVIIDDGSMDNTKEVLEPYQHQIRYIHQNNQGVAAARNHGIAQANGELIAFLDADDYFLPGKLSAQADLFRQDPSLGIVHSGWQRVDFQGQKLLDVRPWENVPKLDLEDWLRWKPVLPSAMMFRREWLEYVDGFDPRFPPAEDTELILRMALKGCRATWLKEITVGYRQHPESAMHKGLPQARSLTAVTDNFFQQPNLPEKVRLMEHSVRYGTLVWIAWYLHYTKHPVEMGEYLRQSWQYRPFAPTETIINWIESFAEFSQNWGVGFDAYSLTNSLEWQDLMKWVIGVNPQRDSN